MDYDALCRSPLRCWGHDDCREHPELGVLCGEHPLEMCVSDEQRFAMEHIHANPCGDGDPPYAPSGDGDGGVGDPSGDWLDHDNDYDDRNGGENGFHGGEGADGDGVGCGDRWSRQIEGEMDLLAEDATPPYFH